MQELDQPDFEDVAQDEPDLDTAIKEQRSGIYDHGLPGVDTPKEQQ